MVRVKICGITNLEDALAAAEAGADAVGLVFAPSPRRVDPETARRIVAALPPMVMAVGVFADQPPAYVCQVRGYCGLHAVQLHGREDPHLVRELGRGVIKALTTDPQHPPRPDAYPGTTLLLDAHHPQARGGTGTTCDWNLARDLARQRRLILAGGLGPHNVAQAVATVRPFAVDASSGVEKAPGRKDHELMARFIAQAKAALN